MQIFASAQKRPQPNFSSSYLCVPEKWRKKQQKRNRCLRKNLIKKSAHFLYQIQHIRAHPSILKHSMNPSKYFLCFYAVFLDFLMLPCDFLCFHSYFFYIFWVFWVVKKVHVDFKNKFWGTYKMRLDSMNK